MNSIIGKGKQLTLLVENETRQVERKEVIWSRQGWEKKICLCRLFITLFSSVLQVILLLFHLCISHYPPSSTVLHLATLSHSSFNFQGSPSVTATVSDSVEAPLSKTGAVTVKCNACMNTSSHVQVAHHSFFFLGSTILQAVFFSPWVLLSNKAKALYWQQLNQPFSRLFLLTLSDSESCAKQLLFPNTFSWEQSKHEQHFIKYAI